MEVCFEVLWILVNRQNSRLYPLDIFYLRPAPARIFCTGHLWRIYGTIHLWGVYLKHLETLENPEKKNKTPEIRRWYMSQKKRRHRCLEKHPCPIQIIPCILQVDFQLLHFLMRFGVKRLGTGSRFSSNMQQHLQASAPILATSSSFLRRPWHFSSVNLKKPKMVFFILRIYTKHKSNVKQAEQKVHSLPTLWVSKICILGSACVCMCALQVTAVAEYEKAVCYSLHQQIISDYEIDRHFNNHGALCSAWISK